MPHDVEHSLLTKAAAAFLTRMREWRPGGGDLDGLASQEIERIGAELGMTATDLRALAARGPDAADLLHRRIKSLGVTRGDVERTALGLMRDLERTCSCCDHKVRCEHDLATLSSDPAWKCYCTNATSLEAARAQKERRES